MNETNKARQFYFGYFVVFLIILSLVLTFQKNKKNIHLSHGNNVSKPLKLYWFIPDGLRSEPVTFKIYSWAAEGKLPNIKKLMEQGSYGYSIPVFPGHTPTNFATLLTGTTPDVHGVADGAMRIEGYPLNMASKGGFTSQAKLVTPIWNTLEENHFLVSLLSIPGSTPPELSEGITIKGRWGGWGVEFPAIIFHSNNDKALKLENGQNKRVFNFGSELTKFINAKPLAGWKIKEKTFSPAFEIDLKNWNASLYAMVIDTTDDNLENYDSVVFSKDKQNVFAKLRENEWSSWLPIKLEYELKNDYNINTPKKSEIERKFSSIEILTETKIKVIKLRDKNSFRIRFLYNNLNEYLIKPSYLYDQISNKVGPMVDFVDNYPPQLIYFKEDKNTFIEEANYSLDWHRKMSNYMIENFPNDIIFHSIYTPNQMMTSRWWMPYLDPESPNYKLITDDERSILWNEMLSMYKKIDDIIGDVINHSNQDTFIIFSSDHGAIPLYKEVRLNNLFAKKGWLKFKYIESEGEYEIDWDKSKVVFLQMDNVYINTKGLAGPYYHDSGPEYEKLRSEVAREIENLQDENGIKPLAQILKREDAKKLNLPMDRTGDLIVANSAHYNWVEDMSNDLTIFHTSLKGGYKQAVLPDKNIGMWTPFIISGPGIRKNYALKNPINHIDQYATILKVLKIPPTAHQKGKILNEVFE
jgi:predicted AlkP superfamily phosphohydrolase/phosphomutase